MGTEWQQALATGLFLGMVYALIALGFAITFGVMRIANFAHGEFVVAGMYAMILLHQDLGVPALIAIPVAALLTAALGMVFVSILLFLTMTKPIQRLSPLRISEEESWSDLAAVMEESIHGQDDVRTSLAAPSRSLSASSTRASANLPLALAGRSPVKPRTVAASMRCSHSRASARRRSNAALGHSGLAAMNAA